MQIYIITYNINALIVYILYMYTFIYDINTSNIYIWGVGLGLKGGLNINISSIPTELFL